MRRRASMCVCALVMLAVGASSAASAQITTATISGIVKDETGFVLPGVTVTVTNTETGRSRTAVTDSAGLCTVSGLQPGTYQVRAALDGFGPETQTIRLAVGQQAAMQLTLKVGGTEETISVVASSVVVDTRSSSLSALVSEQTIEELPLNGRNFVQLALLQPGITSFKERNSQTVNGRGEQLNVNGAGGRSNSYLLDGANMKGYYGLAVATAAETSLGVETIREFRVVTNAFSADYGRAMGGVINVVTKAGTNDVHGSAFEFYRNSTMDARNAFDVGARPPFKRHQFGGVIGGPIVKNRTFFFGGVEVLREDLGITKVATVLSDAARAGALFPINPTMQKYVDLYPRGNGPDLGGGIARFTYQFNQDTREPFLQGRIDHTLGEKDSVFVRYTWDDSTRHVPVNLPDYSSEHLSTSRLLTAEWKRIFSSRLLNTFRFSHSGLDLNDTIVSPLGPEWAFIPGQPTIGTMSVGGLSAVGPVSTEPGVGNNEYWTFSDDVAYSRGRHFVKTGVLIERATPYFEISTAIRGAYTFPNVQRFLAGTPSNFSGVLPGAQTSRARRNTMYGFYFQDDFQASSRLTLNLGVRYEFYTVPTDTQGRDSALRDPLADADFTLGPLFRNPSLRNIGPRLGFAWDVMGDGRTSVRGGGGLYYDTDGTFNSSQIISTFAPPFALQVNIANPTFPNPPLQGVAGGRSARTLDYDIQQPRLWTYNVNVQRELPGGIVTMVGYAGSRGYELVRAADGNPNVATTDANGQTFFPAQAVRRNRAWGFIDYRTSGGRSWYNALQTALMKRLSDGLQAQATYTFSKVEDNTQAQLAADATNQNVYSTHPYDPLFDKGRADFDIRHVFTFNFTYELPWGREWTGAKGVLLAGWQVNGLGSLRSGVPFSPAIVTNWSRSGNTQSGNDRPNLVPGRSSDGLVLGGTRQFFDPAAFVLQPAGYLGNTPRGYLSGPNLSSYDLSLVKNVRLGGTVTPRTVEVRLELFNIFNHANYAVPNRTVFAGAQAGEAPLPTAGQITSTVTDGRQVQLGVKFRF